MPLMSLPREIGPYPVGEMLASPEPWRTATRDGRGKPPPLRVPLPRTPNPLAVDIRGDDLNLSQKTRRTMQWIAAEDNEIGLPARA